MLVPRWLRRQHAAAQPEYDTDYASGQADYDGSGYEDEAPDYGAAPGDGTEMSAPSTAAEDATETQYYTRSPAASRHSRSRVLQARRRLLTMLVLLMAAAGACTALKLTAWWVCIAPAAMLSMYLLLLRETAIADAERARRLAEMEWRAQAARQRAYRARARQAPEEQPSAEIIDISARVGDMLYDQYADATVRAVGD
jgi:hypothetical protein